MALFSLYCPFRMLNHHPWHGHITEYSLRIPLSSEHPSWGQRFDTAKIWPPCLTSRIDLPETWTRFIWPSFNLHYFRHATKLSETTFQPPCTPILLSFFLKFTSSQKFFGSFVSSQESYTCKMWNKEWKRSPFATLAIPGKVSLELYMSWTDAQ